MNISCCINSCESCKNRLFARKSTVSCPFCTVNLQKRDFYQKSAFELNYENELRIRESLSLWFNEVPEDFPSNLEYDDYLELREDIGKFKSRNEN